MPVASRLIAAWCGAAMASCQPPTSPSRPLAVDFVAESDPGVRLSGVSVFVDGNLVGETGSNGRVRMKINGESTQRLTIKHHCPEGHDARSASKVLRLRDFDGVVRSDAPEMEFMLRCRPMKRSAAFVVRAKNGPGLPVVVDGEPMARTNRFGVAHFSIRGAPGTDYVVQLDTEDHPGLLPQHPLHTFTLPDADEIFVLNRTFEVKMKRRRPGYRRPRITRIE